MFPRRNNVARKIWKQLNDEFEPLNQKLKKELGFPKENRNVIWDEIAFNPSIHIYAEALNCFQHRLFEAATIMCRDAIDSAILAEQEFEQTIFHHHIKENRLETRMESPKNGVGNS